MIATAAPNFIGVTLDYGSASALTFPLSPQLVALARGLSPGVLRIGGAAEDLLTYQPVGGSCPSPPPAARPDGSYHCPQQASRGCLTLARWRELNEFSTKAGLDLVFGLNACTGRPAVNASMDFGAIEGLLRWTARDCGPSCAPWAFELGNELDGSYAGSDGVAPEALGRDLLHLHGLIAELWPNATGRPRLLGPDVVVYTGGTGTNPHFARMLRQIVSRRGWPYDGGLFCSIGMNLYFERMLTQMGPAAASTLSALTFHQCVEATVDLSSLGEADW